MTHTRRIITAAVLCSIALITPLATAQTTSTTSTTSTTETPAPSPGEGEADTTSIITTTSSMPTATPTTEPEPETALDRIKKREREEEKDIQHYTKGRVNNPPQHIDWTLTFGADFYAEHNIVVFGDSIYANPARISLRNKNVLNVSPDNIPGGKNHQGCIIGGINIPSELRKYTNKPIMDYTCAGAAVTFETPAADMYESVQHAINTRALNATTDQVIINIGMVDYNLVNSLQGVPVNWAAPSKAMADVEAKMTEYVNRIKTVSPNAQITLVSYPAISSENGTVCPIRTDLDGNNAGVALDVTFKTYEDRADWTLWKVAQNTGSRYFDMRSATRHNNMCAPNEMRYISGSIEKTLPFNMTNHLTHEGVYAVGKILADNVLLK